MVDAIPLSFKVKELVITDVNSSVWKSIQITKSKGRLFLKLQRIGRASFWVLILNFPFQEFLKVKK